MGFDFGGTIPDEFHVVAGGHPDKQAGPGARQARGSVPGVFDGLPHGFHKEPLLWIHQLRLPWRNAEKEAIELVHIRHESTPLDLIGVDGRIEFKAPPVPPVFRNFSDQVVSVDQVFPEGFRILGSGHDTAHADDGNGPVFCFRVDRFDGRKLKPVGNKRFGIFSRFRHR